MPLPRRLAPGPWVWCGALAAVLTACGGGGIGPTGGDSGSNSDSGTNPGNDSGTPGNDAGGGGPDGGGGGPDAGQGHDAGNNNNNDGGSGLCFAGGSDGGGAFTTAGPGGYPASHLAPPIEIYGCDRLLYAPKVVTVTFANELGTNVTNYETLDDTLITSSWWDAVTQGYVGNRGPIQHGSSGGHVKLTTNPALSYTDTASLDGGAPSTIKDFIKTEISNGTFPAPDENTLYAVYFPSNPHITLSSGTQKAQSCVAFGGYHSSTTVETANGPLQVPYAIMPTCPLLQLLGIQTTVAASHEIIEATTDPFVSDVQANGYYMDQSRDAWQAITAAEVGDVCALLQDFQGVVVSPPPNPPASVYQFGSFAIQRSFSNASLLAGHDPCVPAPSGVYFNVAPNVEKLVLQTGQSQVIQLTGFSEAATSDWNVKALDFGYLATLKTTLQLTLDKTTANNGTTLNLTVKVTGTVDPVNGAPFVIVSWSTNGQQVAFWPGIVETH
jgi:hypothetical protein